MNRLDPPITTLGQGACFGFDVRAQAKLNLLRGGGGTPLEIKIRPSPDVECEDSATPLFTWKARPGHPFSARLYESRAGYALWVDGIGRFLIDPGGQTIHAPFEYGVTHPETSLWGIPAMLCFMARGDLPLHAAAVEVGDSALLLAAPGRFGKTTLAAAFVGAGDRLLSEDITCCRLNPDGAVVLPGPAFLRVRRDVYDRIDLSGTSVLIDEPERVTVALPADARGSGDAVRVRGIVFLHEASSGIRIEPVAQHEALRDLWALAFKLPSDESMRFCFTQIAGLVARVPAWRLLRKLEFDTLPAVTRALAEIGTSAASTA
jgi:hypothetical protein